jgi:hypothetical protein
MLFEQESKINGKVRVVQWGDNWRSMNFDGIPQGIAFVGSDGTARPEVLGSEYTRVMAAAAVGYARLNGHDIASGRFVFAGLGAGQLPCFLEHHFPGAVLEVAEIDAVVGPGGLCSPRHHPDFRPSCLELSPNL